MHRLARFLPAFWPQPIVARFSPSLHPVRTTTHLSSCPLTEAVDPSEEVKKEDSPAIQTIGWVRSIRRHKTRVFFQLSDGTTPRELQVVCQPEQLNDQLNVGSAVAVSGHLVAIRPRSKDVKPQQIGMPHPGAEIVADNIRLLSPGVEESSSTTCPLNGALGGQTPRPDLGLLRSALGLPWRHRLSEFGAMLRMRARVKRLVHKVMQESDYLEVDPPILTSVDCEGTSETFRVIDRQSSLDSRLTPVHLTGSAQLHLEALALGLSKVYCLSPAFRAESSNTRHHLAEFHMLEAESVHLDTVDRLCDEIERIVRLTMSGYLDLIDTPHRTNDLDGEESDVGDVSYDAALVIGNLSEDVQQSPGSVRSNGIDLLPLKHRCAKMSSILSKPFVRMTYEEARKSLNMHNVFDCKNRDFSKEEENLLVEKFNSPVFITHFPMSSKPFYCESRDGQYAEAVDLLFPGIGELIGGSVRSNCEKTIKERLSTAGPLDTSSLDWYAALRTQGSAPHGGFGLGFERLLQYLLGVYNIRDVITFPRVWNKIVL